MGSGIDGRRVAMPGNGDVRAFLRSGAAFVAIGILLYGALYAASESLVYRYGDRNRFFMVKTAPRAQYDYVVLGASHAGVFDYEDINARLESLTGSTVLNLSIPGAGVVVNRLVLDYFLVEHHARTIVYVVDSFAFYSPEWNERRLEDVRLFHRAPFDLRLARLLLRSRMPLTGCLDYIAGFSKINNPTRFAPDNGGAPARFDRIYRPIAQLDRERIAYLYPAEIDARARALRGRYLAELESLIRRARSLDIRVHLVRPPLPGRIHRLIPGEAEFDAALARVARRSGAAVRDLARAAPDDKFFFDTDHLNRAGVLHLLENHLGELFGE
jgi:hypothetical protein